jgi:DNA polymerase III sliding clamp (beta) subunit (PCNA family)
MKATLSGEALNQLVGSVKAFTGKSDVRPQNQFIHILFSADGCKATAYAIDGYRAAKESVVCGFVDEDFDVMVLAPRIKAKRVSNVEVYRDGDRSFIDYGDITFRTQRPDGTPFDVEGFISGEAAKENKQAFGINADYMIDALRSLKESGAAIRKPVIVEFTSPLAPVLLRTDADNYKVILPVRLHGE